MYRWCLCHIPNTLTKSGRVHTFPLGGLVSSLSTKLLHEEGTSRSGSPFPARWRTNSSFNGWSRSKWLLDNLAREKNRTLHDLRRTFATRLAEQGGAPDRRVIARTLQASQLYRRAWPKIRTVTIVTTLPSPPNQIVGSVRTAGPVKRDYFI